MRGNRACWLSFCLSVLLSSSPALGICIFAPKSHGLRTFLFRAFHCHTDCHSRRLQPRKLQDSALEQFDSQLVHFVAERRRGQCCVGAHDVALGPVRNPAKDVAARPVRQAKTDERAASVMRAPSSKTERLQILMKAEKYLRIEQVLALRSANRAPANTAQGGRALSGGKRGGSDAVRVGAFGHSGRRRSYFPE